MQGSGARFTIASTVGGISAQAAGVGILAPATKGAVGVTGPIEAEMLPVGCSEGVLALCTCSE